MLAKILPWVGAFIVVAAVNLFYFQATALTQFQKPDNYDHFDVMLFRRSNDAMLPPVVLRPYAEYQKGSLHAFKADSPGFPEALPLTAEDFSLRPPAWPETPSEDLQSIDKFFSREYSDHTYSLTRMDANHLSVELVYNGHDHRRKDVSTYVTDGKTISSALMTSPNGFEAMLVSSITIVIYVFLLIALGFVRRRAAKAKFGHASKD
jgi:hypothetical protein